MSKKDYRKLSGQVGIYKHQHSKNYLAIKKIDGKVHQKTFQSISEAKIWRKSFDGEEEDTKNNCSTLKN